MARAPFQVLIFPFHFNDDGIVEYAVFRRPNSERGFWQGIAGGGEDSETHMEAAKRETWEEAGIPKDFRLVVLDSVASIPVLNVVGKFLWGDKVLIIPEYCFGVGAKEKQLNISKEHIEYKWVNYEEAVKMLKWDSNKNALWELNERLLRSGRSKS